MVPYGSNSKDSTCSAGDPDSIPGLGRSPGEGNGCLIQYSYQENSTDRGAWRATVMGLQRVGHDWATNTHTHLPNGAKAVSGWQAYFIIFLFPQYLPPFGLCSPPPYQTTRQILSSTYYVNIFMFSVTLTSRFYSSPESLCKLELIASLPDTLGSPSYWPTLENKVRNVWLVMAESENLPVYTVAKAFRVLI